VVSKSGSLALRAIEEGRESEVRAQRHLLDNRAAHAPKRASDADPDGALSRHRGLHLQSIARALHDHLTGHDVKPAPEAFAAFGCGDPARKLRVYPFNTQNTHFRAAPAHERSRQNHLH
jgi:hypothetical protein